MIIKNQFGDEIVNVTGDFVIAIRQDPKEDFWLVLLEYKYQNLSVEDSYCLGIYSQYWEAKDALEEIFKKVSMGKSSFEMSEEEQPTLEFELAKEDFIE